MSHHQTTNKTIKWKAVYVIGRSPPLHQWIHYKCNKWIHYNIINNDIHRCNGGDLPVTYTVFHFIALLVVWWWLIPRAETSRQVNNLCNITCCVWLESWIYTQLWLIHQLGCSYIKIQNRYFISLTLHNLNLRKLYNTCSKLEHGKNWKNATKAAQHFSGRDWSWRQSRKQLQMKGSE
jgi:hypothetical protein